MFIKLTTWEKYTEDGKPIYLNPLTITSIWTDTLCTRVDTVDGGWYVKETPEDILEEINGKFSIYEKITIFGKERNE